MRMKTKRIDWYGVVYDSLDGNSGYIDLLPFTTTPIQTTFRTMKATPSFGHVTLRLQSHATDLDGGPLL